MIILYALLALLVTMLVTTITSLYDITILMRQLRADEPFSYNSIWLCQLLTSYYIFIIEDTIQNSSVSVSLLSVKMVLTLTTGHSFLTIKSGQSQTISIQIGSTRCFVRVTRSSLMYRHSIAVFRFAIFI